MSQHKPQLGLLTIRRRVLITDEMAFHESATASLWINK